MYCSDTRFGLGGWMRVSGVVGNLPVDALAAPRELYADSPGLSVEGFNLGWVAHYQSPDGEAHVQLVTRDAKAPKDSVISVHVGSGVEEAYEEPKRRGFEIVYPLRKSRGVCADSSFAPPMAM